MKRKCDYCHEEYEADNRNIKRGWGLCCSKSCAAHKREAGKAGYNVDRVRLNNARRESWGQQSDRQTGEEYYYENTHPFDSDALGQE